MALKELLKRGVSSLFKKKKTDPVSGDSQKLITYTKESKQLPAKELAKKDAQLPVRVERNITDDLLMGQDKQPLFGSSTYDWVMKKGPGQYSADDWINHLTSSRKVNFKVFGKNATRTERGPKRFTYDRGSRFAGKEATINKEELFDTNLATFDGFGEVTGGLLGAAKRFNLKLSAQDIGNMIKMNPANRLKAIEYGGVFDSPKINTILQGVTSRLDDLTKTAPNLLTPYESIRPNIRSLERAIKNGDQNSVQNAYKVIKKEIDNIKGKGGLDQNQQVQLNSIMGGLDEVVRISKGGGGVKPVKYANESSYTLPGGTNYRETVFVLDEPILGNRSAMKSMGHYDDLKNNIMHVRYDTRITPDGKKAMVIHEIQSDANQRIAKKLTAKEAFAGERRINPFQKDIEMDLLVNSRTKLLTDMDDAIAKGQFNKSRAISDDLRSVNKQINSTFQRADDYNYPRNYKEKLDYFPLLDADAYGDYSLKFLMNKAAKENFDYVAVMPFNKLHFKQGYKAGNERFYGYASGKGIGNKGQAVMPQLMKKAARFQDSKAGTIKLSLSDPNKPYKIVDVDTFKYPDGVNKGKTIKSSRHTDAFEEAAPDTRLIESNNPNLYFDAFAIEVKPNMAYTQKLYKAQGGLVVDMFKTL